MKTVIACGLALSSLAGLAGEILLPQLLPSSNRNQITVSIPLNFEMNEAPSTSFSASFKKIGGAQYLFLEDAFLGPDKRSIIATNFFTNSDLKPGSYKLSGIFYQGTKSDASGGWMIQANCQNRFWDGNSLSCYDNGVLLPEKYRPIRLKVSQMPNQNQQVHQYQNLIIGARAERLDFGGQKVELTVSSTPLVFRYFVNYVVFSGAETGQQVAYFQPQTLAQANLEKNSVAITHHYDQSVPALRGLVVDKLYGKNEFGEFISLTCDKKSMKYEIAITQHQYPRHGDRREGRLLEIPCALVE
ncbi:MAG: hypothetical protein A2X86_20135 [Bdellovibrionales bacterium GWA2_49_15]|nr:MAG: hypothetical protein A2X86_20135 [Bdellovibrionales bacterium GWA2_49_15]HAZ11378.1 hypothetical protein [Bdellovibrionales bacterium]